MTGWVVATETIRPMPAVTTRAQMCRLGLSKLMRLSGKYGKGKVTYVSLEDYEYLRQFTWRVNNSGYVVTSWWAGKNKQRTVFMHRLVLVRAGLLDDLFSKLDGDHKNRNPLSNVRNNLRVVTRLQNAINRGRSKNNATGYMGVFLSTEKRYYIATLTHDWQKYRVEPFATPEEAAVVRDAMARFYHGSFATTNFPGTEAYSWEDASEAAREKVRAAHASRFVGVTARANRAKWQARANLPIGRKWLGDFDTQEAAARAVDDARAAHGLPRVNFPDEMKQPSAPRGAFLIRVKLGLGVSL